MKQTLRNQKGFAALEAILIVIIVGIIGGTGYYVYHATKKTDDTLNDVSKTNQNTGIKQKAQQSTEKKASQLNRDPNADYGNCLAQSLATPPTASVDDSNGSCSICANGTNSLGQCYQKQTTYTAPTTFSTALIVGYSTLPASAQSAVTTIAKDTFPLLSPPACYNGGKIPGYVVVDKIVNNAYIRLNVRHNCGDPITTILASTNGKWAVILSRHLIGPSDLEAHNLPSSLLGS